MLYTLMKQLQPLFDMEADDQFEAKEKLWAIGNAICRGGQIVIVEYSKDEVILYLHSRKGNDLVLTLTPKTK